MNKNAMDSLSGVSDSHKPQSIHYTIKFDSSQTQKLATCTTYALSTPNDELGIL